MTRQKPAPRINQTKTGRLWGYARVSSRKQEANSSFEVQNIFLRNAGVPKPNITQETGSSKDNKLPFKKALINLCQSGDTLHVISSDRFGRQFLECESELIILQSRGVNVYFGNQLVTSKRPVNILLRRMLLMFSEFSNSERSERTRAGIRKKISEKGGWAGGRPNLSIKPGLIEKAWNLFNAKTNNAKTKESKFLYTKVQVAEILKICVSSAYRIYNRLLQDNLVEPRRAPKNIPNKNIPSS